MSRTAAGIWFVPTCRGCRPIPHDERQQQQVTQALAPAYRVLGGILTVGVVALVVGGEGLLARVRTAQVEAGLTFALMFLVAFLPSSILAWDEPEITE